MVRDFYFGGDGGDNFIELGMKNVTLYGKFVEIIFFKVQTKIFNLMIFIFVR